MQEICTGVFGSTGASFLECKGATPSLQENGDEDDELEK